jgi:hypothetical protein
MTRHVRDQHAALNQLLRADHRAGRIELRIAQPADVRRSLLEQVCYWQLEGI